MTARLTAEQLAEASTRLITWNQHERGGYVASPLFSHYTFSWLRDGSFIAYGMDGAGQHDSSRLFYEWVSRIIESKKPHIDDLLGKKERGEFIPQEQFLHTRYYADGRDDEQSDWGHFQLDGYGAWLWGLSEHLKATGQPQIPDAYRQAVDATVAYLVAFWQLPNFDCWEEYAEFIHPSTLACLYGGLKAIARLDRRNELETVCASIREFLLQHAVHPDGHFVKNIAPVKADDTVTYKINYEGVDASLLWLFEPFHMFEADHPAMEATLNRIDAELRTAQGGLRRYASDTYYGGGEWLLLTAWYGWAALSRGRRETAEAALHWIVSKADASGRLPEQVPDALPSREGYEHWVSKWGPPARPLLWSHGMYLVLYHRLYPDSIR
ncbi:glycoside hydrolase family 15 protein [Paenibacillus sp.]|uniref:glycoside hydrolase family 15 protein n=1 Tax=Paenibacillus sp. TaxID=58172 RepID=UPI0035669503